MTPRYTSTRRIPIGVTLLLVVAGFVLVLTGIPVLQVVGIMALMISLGVAFFGPAERIESHEPGNRTSEPSRTNGDATDEGDMDRNGYISVANGSGQVVAGPPRDAETSRRRARKKREESAGAPGR